MYKVVVVEDEEIARKGIIFTINWEALNCMIAGEAANGEIHYPDSLWGF